MERYYKWLVIHKNLLILLFIGRNNIYQTMAEIWKRIIGYKGYEVSNMGRVRSSFGRGDEYRMLKQGYGDGRYCQVVLMKDGVPMTKRVHRLVGETFLPNPENKPQIDHIDGNYLNNNADNLRWATPSENTNNPNTINHLRGSKEEQRKQREARKMIQRLERMRTNDRCIITDHYMIFYDKIYDRYLLSYETDESNKHNEIADSVKKGKQPDQFHTLNYLNEDGSISYYKIWADIERLLTLSFQK